MFESLTESLQNLLGRLAGLRDHLGDIPTDLQQIPDYLRVAWETAVYLYSPASLALAAAAAALMLLLRVYLGGIAGALLRLVVYIAIFRTLSTHEAFAALFSDQPSAAPIIAGILMVALWLPVTVIGGLIRLGRRRRQRPRIGAASTPTAGGGQPFDIQRRDDEKKQIICIMMTDIVGYSAKMEKDEAATFTLLKDHNQIMRAAITRHRGREIKTIGDAFMVVFESPLLAVQCGIAMQKALRDFNKNRPANEMLRVRIGIHQGEVIVTAKDVFGEGVNIAARMESITDPGGISVSGEIYTAIKGKVTAGFQSIGYPKLKNIAKPPEVFKVQLDDGV